MAEAEKGALRFDDLLEPYRSPAEPAAVDESARQAERRAERARRQVARAGFEVHVDPAEGDTAQDAEQYRLVLRCGGDGRPWEADVSVRARPLTLPAHTLTALDVTALDPAARAEQRGLWNGYRWPTPPRSSGHASRSGPHRLEIR